MKLMKTDKLIHPIVIMIDYFVLIFLVNEEEFIEIMSAVE